MKVIRIAKLSIQSNFHIKKINQNISWHEAALGLFWLNSSLMKFWFKSLWWLSWNGGYLGKDTCKHLTWFSWYPLSKPVDSTMQNINPVSWSLVYIHFLLKEIIKIGIPKLESFSDDFVHFIPKMTVKLLKFSCVNRLKDWTSLW